MSSQLPEGHPGDFVWRLPLARTLATFNLVSSVQLERANEALKQGGLFASRLLEQGVSPDKLLVCWASATGLHAALPRDVRHPKHALSERVSEEVCRALLAVPVDDAGGLKLAVAVPLSAEQAARLPPHTALIALEPDVRQGLEALWPRQRHKVGAFPGEVPPPPSQPPHASQPPQASQPPAPQPSGQPAPQSIWSSPPGPPAPEAPPPAAVSSSPASSAPPTAPAAPAQEPRDSELDSSLLDTLGAPPGFDPEK